MSAKLRAAVIGAGWYAALNHIPMLARRDDVELDGVSRLGAEDLAKVQSHFGFAFASEDFRAVLARKPDIVVVASPHHLHYEHTAAALEAGAHVLCEKPMTLDPAEAWDLVARAKRLDRHLLIANGFNYLDQVDTLAARIADGLIGEIEHAMVSFISATRDVFSGEAGLKGWQTSMFRPARDTWQDPAKGGGFAYGQMSHALSLLFYLTGQAPVSISGQVMGTAGVDLANAATLTLTNGAVVSVSGAAGMPQGHHALLRLFISGSGGVVMAEFDRNNGEIRFTDGTVETLDLAPKAWSYRCDGPIDALVELARGRGSNRSPGHIGAQTTATIAAMLASAKAGGAVRPIRGPG